ncbi:SbcC/MukB-like Walker B domain-containing protein [Mesorhizobium sp.]|uniref:SbcC/MukB-like Walker B domain-containing protein n=1 Tax=Mesorhizobium sp. TaxID=1871066 RepID=UPI001209E323|nr:SbcC/MukB-like Walker B domain-containing protein [Mesorhizobium sp.]TIM11731.1 MAG: hypothetical protein E5Y62_00610 [Mesorhizobium sp.]
MMELVHLALVNWHAFNVEDIPVSGHVGFLGENASGKSTILDMIQVVLTGASGRYMNLNPVAGESRRRSGPRRTVQGYCLGAHGEGDFRREACLTYVTISFRDADGVKPDLTVGLAMEARKTQPAETVLGRFVVRGKILKTTDFLREREGRQEFAQWEEVRQSLEGECGGGFVNHRDSATDHIREYMRDLVPRSAPTSGNAAALAKAIVNGMTLNQGLSATDFVRSYILEESPMRISELRESLKTYRQVNQTIKNMRERAKRLKVVKARAEEFRNSLNEHDEEDWINRKARYLAASAAMRALEEEIKEAEASLLAESEEITDLNHSITEANQDVHRIIKQIEAIKARTGIDDLKKMADSHSYSATDCLKRVSERVKHMQRIAAAAEALGKGEVSSRELAAHASALAEAVRCGNTGATAVVEQAFLASLPIIAERIGRARSEAEATLHTKTEDVGKLSRSIEAAASGSRDSHLGDHTRELMRLFRMAGMIPRALCDIIDLTDKDWAQAAEGLLGRDREAIFVDRDHIHGATAILRENRRELRQASLVSLNKLERYQDPAQAGWFPSLFRSDDKDALAFLQRRYGNVRLARTMDGFNQPGRALMADGLYDDGLVRGTRLEEASRLKIGKTAQEQLLLEQKRRLEELQEEIETLSQRRHVLSEVDRSAAILASTADGETVVGLLARAQEQEGLAQEARSRLEAVDQGDLKRLYELEEKKKVQQAYIQARNGELTSIQKRQGAYQKQAETARKTLESLTSQEGSRHSRNLARRLFHYSWRLTAAVPANRRYRKRMADKQIPSFSSARYAALAGIHRAIGQRAEDRSKQARDRMMEADRGVRAAMRSYFDIAPLSSVVGVESDILKDILPWAEATIRDIEENELTRHEELADEASERVSSIFRGEFVNSLHSRISKLKRDIDALNHSLRNHTFHGERYSFSRTQLAQYAPILKAVEIYVTSEDALELLFKGEIPEDSPHKPVLDEVKRILEHPDTDFDSFEDYRNFFVFEIHMENLDTGHKTRWETRRGTGSGAEQQVPLYVAIGASLASVYGTAEGRFGSRLGMALAVFDEAFAKLDGKNQRQMMRFYESLGLQVVVAAPPERRPSLLGYMHAIVEVDNIGNGQSETTVVQVREKARKELLRINPELMDDEALRRMAAE